MSQPFALLLSILIEASVASAVVAALRWGSGIRAALAAALGTLATHWPAWQAIAHLDGMVGYLPAVLVVETAVVLVESVVYRMLVPLPGRRALSISLVANGASVVVGLALYAFKLA
jgi:hypothetical protein